MRNLVLVVAGLGWRDLEMRGMIRSCGLTFSPAQSVFPAVTCTVQGSIRTASLPSVHGMTSNGYWNHQLFRPSFWEQSSSLVSGQRIWAPARERGETVAVLFFQQSLGESVDFVLSPAPIHKHGGGMIMENYVRPNDLVDLLKKNCGTFPLHRYWGPLASPAVGEQIVKTLSTVCNEMQPDWTFAYLPTLDYDLQRFGPDDARCNRSFEILQGQLERCANWCSENGVELTVMGDYGIHGVTRPVSFPNQLLRKAGFFNTRTVHGMAYPDFYTSRAFAMADHEIAHVYVRDPEDIPLVADVFLKSEDYSEVALRTENQEWGHPSAGDILLTAQMGSWCSYKWWTDYREAPDFAGHVDIHNKPGYDPCELFFDHSFPPKTCQDDSRIHGTHGRKVTVAFASTRKDVKGESIVELAGTLV